MISAILNYLMIGCLSYMLLPQYAYITTYINLSIKTYTKNEKLLIYWLCWPIPAIIILCAAVSREFDKERYVVRNKYIKIKRRNWF